MTAHTSFHRIDPVQRRRSFATRIIAILMLATILQPLFGSPAAAQEGATGLPENALQASVRIMTNVQVTPDDEDVEPFLCMLDEETVLDVSVGSGTIISEDGYILTNHHVAADERMPREFRNYCEDQAPRGKGTAEFTKTIWTPDTKGNPGEAYRSELIQDSSMQEDLAVLRITEHLDGSRVSTRRDPFPFVEFGDSDALREPEKIILIGYPANAGISRRVSEGIFSGWGDNGYGVPWIYTDATISGGNSGGTAVNGQGLFVGIPTEATFSDCRPGDTNNDGVIDTKDQGCIGLGGNYGILIPSNIARAFAEEATGEEFPVATPVAPVNQDDPTQTPNETPDPADTDGPPIGEITFTAYDESGSAQDSYQNVNLLEGCFENLTIQHGQAATTTWFLDDEVFTIVDFDYDEAWNPIACARLQVKEGEEVPFLDPGTYRVEVETDGKTVVSKDIEVTLSTNIESVSFRGKDVDGKNLVPADDNVINGEVVTLYADIEFTEMTDGSIWQAEWYLEGDLVFASDPEVWESGASDTETARMRNTDRGPLEPGAYEVVISIDGVVSDRATIVIED